MVANAQCALPRRTHWCQPTRFRLSSCITVSAHTGGGGEGLRIAIVRSGKDRDDRWEVGVLAVPVYILYSMLYCMLQMCVACCTAWCTSHVAAMQSLLCAAQRGTHTAAFSLTVRKSQHRYSVRRAFPSAFQPTHAYNGGVGAGDCACVRARVVARSCLCVRVRV